MNSMMVFANTSHVLGVADWVTLGAYFAVLLGVAWWVVHQKTNSSNEYFLAGRKMGWFVIGTSLFASNIGSEHLVGLAGTGASDGMAMAHYELHAWCLLVLGWVMVPFYERSCVYTMPEFLERRYCSSARWILSLISLVAYIFTKISVTLFAGGIIFDALFAQPLVSNIDNFWLGAFGMVVITGLYTILGGLRAVLYTEAIQTIVLLLGASCVLFIGLHQVGGWDRLKEVCQDTPRIVVLPAEQTPSESPAPTELTAGTEGSSTNSLIPMTETESSSVAAEDSLADSSNQVKIGPAPSGENLDFFNLWKPNSDPKYPWFGLLFGAPIVGLWYWCSDQYIVQRTLAARDQKQARRGTIFGSYLKLTPVFLFIVPGMIAYALAAQGKIGPGVLENPNQAFPILVKEVLPMGLRGIVIGGLLAALMSSLASVFNSCSTLFTMDIYKKCFPKSSEETLVWIGRLATGFMVVLGLAWIPIIQFMPGTLYDYLQSIQSYIAPPIAAVFFLGVFSKRVNSFGCLAGLLVGFVLGICRLVLELLHLGSGQEMIDSIPWLRYFATTSFTFVSIYLTLISVCVIFLVSWMTPKPSESHIIGLTYATTNPEDKAITRASWNKWDVLLTLGLLCSIVAIYIYFTG